MAVKYNDTFTGANGAAWNAEWAITVASAPTPTIDTNRGKMATDVVASIYAGAMTKNHSRQNQEILVKLDKSGTPAVWAVGMNGAGALGSGGNIEGAYYATGYRFYGPGNGTTAILEKRSAGAASTIASNIAAGDAGGVVWIRMRMEPTTNVIKVRTWADGTAEPTTWTYESLAEVTPLAAGQVFLTANGNSNSGIHTQFWDDVTVDDLVATAVDVTQLVDTPVGTAHAVDASFAMNVAVDSPSGTGRAVDASATGQKSPTVVVDTPLATATAQDATASGFASARTAWSEYPTGVAPADWTARQVTNNLVVQAIAGTVEGHALTGTGTYSLITWNDLGLSNMAETLMRVTKHDLGPFKYVADTKHLRVLLQGTNGSATLAVFDQGGISQGSAAVTVDPAGTNYIRARFEGARLRAKVWSVLVDEPAAWNLDITIAGYETDLAAYGIGSSGLNHSPFTDFFGADNSGATVALYNKTTTLTVDTPTATGTAVDVTARGAASVVLDTPAGTGHSFDATATGTSSPTVVVDTPNATATAPDAKAFTPDIAVVVDTPTATATAVDAGIARLIAVDSALATGTAQDATVSLVTDRTVIVEPARATGRNPYYTETADPFIQTIDTSFGSVPDTLNQDVWLRFGQRDTTPLINYALNSPVAVGSWVGTPQFAILDPFSRKATHFFEDSYTILDYNEATDPRRTLTWEMVFRTSGNGPLWSGDSTAGGRNTVGGATIVDGRLSIYGHVNGFLRTFGVTSVRVDDNQWHHVMVSIGSRGLEVWIDGVSRLVRRPGGSNAATSLVPTSVVPAERVGSTLFPEQGFFAGDILMFAQYGRELIRDAGSTHYYAYSYSTVVRPDTPRATAVAPAAKAKGNRLRALALYANGGEEFNGTGEPNWTSLRVWVNGPDGRRYLDKPFDVGPYTVFPRRMHTNRNEYDLSPRLFSMDDVTDLENYDMFFFVDLPDPHTIFDDTGTTGQVYDLSASYEDFIASIRRAIDRTGISLWCPQPQLAVDLGLVDTITKHSLERESHDIKSFVDEFPGWKSKFTDPTYYFDTHYNNKYRVVNEVGGFTDLGGYVVDDVVYWFNYGNPFSIRPDYAKYNAKHRPNGLTVGDTVYFPTSLAVLRNSADPEEEWARRHVYSVPEGAYRGTAVAKEQTTVNMAGQEIPNPYGDNALTIVVNPGDTVKGKPIGGKILVDFMSGYPVGAPFVDSLAESQRITVQVRPFGTPEQPLLDEYDGYDYDGRRRNAFFEYRKVQTTRTQRQDTGAGAGAGSQEFSRTVTTEVPFFTESEVYPVMFRRQYPWLERGLNWLGDKPEQPDGSARVLVAPATATAKAVDVKVVASRDAVVSVESAIGRAQAVKLPIEPNATVSVFSATATATAIPTQTVADAGTARATAYAPEATAIGEGQDIVLTLRTYTMNVYLKEDR